MAKKANHFRRAPDRSSPEGGEMHIKKANHFGLAAGYVLLYAVAFWLLFYHLDNRLLWGDEAETATLAKNITRFGLPKTYDGTNYILLPVGKDENAAHVWIWSPWLQEYIAAGSFLIFGPTTWAARVPFALIGWMSLVSLALVTHKIYRNHGITLASVALLATSEIFLLHTRQCRYYSVSVLGEILLIYGIYQLFARNRRGLWLAAAALILLFYSNYIIAVANLPALFLLACGFRNRGKQAVLEVVAIFGIVFVAALPWLIYAHSWDQKSALVPENYFGKGADYLREIHFHFMPLWFLLFPLIGAISAYKNQRKTAMEVEQGWEGFLLVLLAYYFVVIVFAPSLFLRYLLPILPVLCLLTGAAIFRWCKWRWLAVLVVAIQCTSNFFSVATAYPFEGNDRLRSPLVEYMRGITTPYTDRFADTLDFLKTRTHPGDTLLSFDPEFPLIFYTQLAIIDARVTAPVKGTLPDWFLPSPASQILPHKPGNFSAFMVPHYDKITISVHDSALGDSIPEPDFYQYETAQTKAPFVIYRLKKP
jgi:Dolichyl-phosphate-mannose-protein mannosyltransferase